MMTTTLTCRAMAAPQTVGVLTATVALIYIIFQIYFDWAWPADNFNESDQEPVEQSKQSKARKIFSYFWIIFHFPFHLALVLVMEGATQFVIWWKVVELIGFVSSQFLEAFRLAEQEGANGIAEHMVLHLNSTINYIWDLYPRDLLVSHFHRNKLLETIGNFSDDHLKNYPTPEEMERQPSHHDFTDAFRGLKLTTLNSILQNFNIESIADAGWDDHPETYEEQAFDDAADKFEFVVCALLTPPSPPRRLPPLTQTHPPQYIYVFCFAGAALILMALLHILARHSSNPQVRSRTSPSPMTNNIVLGANLVLGMGLMLLATMSRYDAHDEFTTTPWIIPSICLVFFFSLVFIHGARWVPSWRG